jgi:hypothetical protein
MRLLFAPRRLRVAVLLALIGLPHGTHAEAKARIAWTALQEGLAYAAIPIFPGQLPVVVEDDKLHVLKVSPSRSRLLVGMAKSTDRRPRTAAEWTRDLKLAAAINLGMYYGDHLTHVGYLRDGLVVQSARWLPRYDSVLVLAAGRAALLDREGGKTPPLDGWTTVVQNMRLARSRDGLVFEGVWARQEKRWSEAAIATDREGNLLLLFCRAPLSMWELNRLLASLPLGVVRAMHVEGGPEASLSIHTRRLTLDLCGSFETGFFLSDLNKKQWPIPNILGVLRR